MQRLFILIALLTILTAGAVFGARLPNQYACLTLWNYVDSSLILYDPARNFFARDTRTPIPLGQSGQNNNYYLLKPEDPEERRRFSLILEPLDDPAAEGIVVETGVYQSGSAWVPERSVWSSDGEKLAYLWFDAAGQEYLTIFNADDQSKRTIPVTVEIDYVPALAVTGWSNDDAYLAIGEMNSLSGFSILAVVDVEEMTLELTPTLPDVQYGAWSPDGHVMAAAVRGEGRRPQLMLFDPERVAEPVLFDVTTRTAPRAISWSPDGRYIAMGRQGKPYGRQRGGLFQWYFDIFTRDGEPVALDLTGKLLPSLVATTGPFGGSGALAANVAPGFWSQDGAMWIYLQERNERNHPRTSLVGFHPETGEFETLEETVVSQNYLRMFAMPYRSYQSLSDVILPLNTSLLMQRWQDGEIALEYVDYAANTRLPLLTGADSLPSAVFSFSEPNQYRWLEDFLIPWVEREDGVAETHLTMFNGDGSIRFDIAGMESINLIGSVSMEWLGYSAERDGIRGIEFVNIETGEHHRLSAELTPTDFFQASVSPDGNHAAVMLMNNRQVISTDYVAVTLYSLEDGTSQFIHQQSAPYGMWSPDSSAYAFFRTEGNSSGVRVVNTNGDILADTDVRRYGLLVSNSLSLFQWSRCEPLIF